MNNDFSARASTEHDGNERLILPRQAVCSVPSFTRAGGNRNSSFGGWGPKLG